MKNPDKRAAARRAADGMNSGADTLVIVNSKQGSGLQYAKWLVKELDCDAISYEKNKLGYSAYYKNVIYIGWVRGGDIMKLNILRQNISNFRLNEKNFIVAAVGVMEPTDTYIKHLKHVNGCHDMRDEKFFLLPGRFEPNKNGITNAAAIKAMGENMYGDLNESDASILRERLKYGYDGVAPEALLPLIKSVKSEQ